MTHSVWSGVLLRAEGSSLGTERIGVLAASPRGGGLDRRGLEAATPCAGVTSSTWLG